MNRHVLMLMACIIPLLLIFLLPTFGIGSSGLSLLLLLIGCFIIHLLLMRYFESHRDQNGKGGAKDAS